MKRTEKQSLAKLENRVHVSEESSPGQPMKVFSFEYLQSERIVFCVILAINVLFLFVSINFIVDRVAQEERHLLFFI